MEKHISSNLYPIFLINIRPIDYKILASIFHHAKIKLSPFEFKLKKQILTDKNR